MALYIKTLGLEDQPVAVKPEIPATWGCGFDQFIYLTHNAGNIEKQLNACPEEFTILLGN